MIPLTGEIKIVSWNLGPLRIVFILVNESIYGACLLLLLFRNVSRNSFSLINVSYEIVSCVVSRLK